MLRNKKINKIWIYNGGIDHNWQDSSCGIRKVNDIHEQKMFNHQAEFMLFLANKNDIVYLVHSPDKEFLDDIKMLGFEEPQIQLIPEEDITISQILCCNKELLYGRLKEGQDYLYVPYILSDYDESLCKQESIKLYGSSFKTVKKINNKMQARKILSDIGLPVIDGYLCSNKEEMQMGYYKLKEMGYVKFAVKEPYNSAGKGVYCIRDDKQFQTFLKMLRFPDDVEEFQVAVEGWIDNKRDINYQIEILPNGAVELLTITEQLILVTSYRGTMYPAQLTSEQEILYQEYAQKIGKKLFSMGYTGLVGIDSIIKEDGSIIPAIEFNARLNQSTFYSPILEKFQHMQRKSIVRSYDIQTNMQLTYPKLKDLLIEEGLYFDKSNNEGVYILNSSCLSLYHNERGMYHSRVFLAITYDKNKDDMVQYHLMDQFIKILQKK
ncbi:MAG: ATP-grasp domain-containing protein [Anaerocolumna sp.]